MLGEKDKMLTVSALLFLLVMIGLFVVLTT